MFKNTASLFHLNCSKPQLTSRLGCAPNSVSLLLAPFRVAGREDLLLGVFVLFVLLGLGQIGLELFHRGFGVAFFVVEVAHKFAYLSKETGSHFGEIG